MVSIIVPVYNAEAWIERCVESVAVQSVADWELILVDDGSSDSSQDICRQLAKDDKRIRVISKKNGGVSSARNEGLRAAKGDYVFFLDSDDRLREDALEVLLRNIESSEADCVVCGIKQDNGKLWAPEGRRSYSSMEDFRRDFPSHLSSELFSVCFNKLYRRSLISASFTEDCSFGEDLMFVLDYLDNCKSIEIIPDALYLHNNLNETSISHNFNPGRLIDIETYQRRVLKFYDDGTPNAFAKYLRDIVAWLYKFYISDNSLAEKKEILARWREMTLLRDRKIRRMVAGRRNKIIIFNAHYVPVKISCTLLQLAKAVKS